MVQDGRYDMGIDFPEVVEDVRPPGAERALDEEASTRAPNFLEACLFGGGVPPEVFRTLHPRIHEVEHGRRVREVHGSGEVLDIGVSVALELVPAEVDVFKLAPIRHSHKFRISVHVENVAVGMPN